MEHKITTKQQAIINAYGEYWDKLKEHIEDDENGWIKLGWGKYADYELEQFLIELNIPLSINDFDCFCTNDFDEGLCYARLKYLTGVNDNNNWKRIESEDDLPKYYETYHVFTKTDIYCKEPKNQGIEDFWINDKYKTDWWLEHVSHYQPIIKPKPPVY